MVYAISLVGYVCRDDIYGKLTAIYGISTAIVGNPIFVDGNSTDIESGEVLFMETQWSYMLVNGLLELYILMIMVTLVLLGVYLNYDLL